MIHTSPWPDCDLPVSSVYNFLWSNPNKLPDTATCIIDGPTGRIHTRGDVKRNSLALAYGLQNKANALPGSVIVIFSPNTFYYHLLVSASQAAGLIVSGANAAYTESELHHQLHDSEATTLLVHPAILNVALQATTALGWSKKRQRASIILAMPRAESGPASDLYKSFDDLISYQLLTPVAIKDPKTTVAYLGYSSGTSGAAKGVRTSHYNMTSVLSILYPMDLSSAKHSDVMIAVLPLNHIYGLSKLLHLPVLLGVPVVVSPPFKIAEFCAQIERFKVTTVLLVPPIALALARDPCVSSYNLSSLRMIISGAAPLGEAIEKEVLAKTGCPLTQAYGLTEMSPTSHVATLDKMRAGSIGPLLPVLRSRIVDTVTGQNVGFGKEGELWLQGPNTMLGYLNRPAADAETLVTDKDGLWLRTGDIAYVDEDGYHFITDRFKELIKVNGFQVAPAELEALLINCPYVNDAAVIGIPTEATELVRAYVVPRAEAMHLSDADLEKAVKSWIEPRVASYKKLWGGVIKIDVIPKSPSGKILRRELRVLAAATTKQIAKL